MRVALLTREYPPNVYGGAGVHAAELARHLAADAAVAVHCFDGPAGDPSGDPLVRSVHATPSTDGPRPEIAGLRWIQADAAMVPAVDGPVDVVHSHTWYVNLAGHMAALVHDVPHVMTSHSLEPLRPWKAEQLGAGYALSTFVERTAISQAAAVIAVSTGMRDDILRAYPEVDPDRVQVIRNGVDVGAWAPRRDADRIRALGVDPTRPIVSWVGRVTRQKGVTHLLDAARFLPEGTQVVLLAGAADTPELAVEFASKAAAARAAGTDVVVVTGMADRADVIALLSASAAFACPSIYEPFGLVNVEAMACGAPVVASAVGGIPEIVVPGATGALVPFSPADDAYGTPADPEGFARDLAAAITVYVDDAALAAAHGRAGRARAEAEFAWTAVAARTVELYRSLV